MGFFKRIEKPKGMVLGNKKTVGLISGKPTNKNAYAPVFGAAKAFGSGLHYAGKDFAKGIKEYKESRGSKPISVKKALELDAKKHGLNKKKEGKYV